MAPRKLNNSAVKKPTYSGPKDTISSSTVRLKFQSKPCQTEKLDEENRPIALHLELCLDIDDRHHRGVNVDDGDGETIQLCGLWQLEETKICQNITLISSQIFSTLLCTKNHYISVLSLNKLATAHISYARII